MTTAWRDRIDLMLSLADGRIAAVDVLARTRPPLNRLFAGKPAETALTALPRVFALCAAAHQVAFLSALDAARRQQAAPLTRHRRISAVVAERLCELLRGLLIGPLAQDQDAAAALRSLLAAVSLLDPRSAAASAPATRSETLSQIKTGLAALGLCFETEEIARGRPLASLMATVSRSGWKQSMPADADQGYLSAADDPAIVARLFDEGACFAGRPDLGGRVPETGAWARRALRRAPSGCGTVVDRLHARLAEVIELTRWLERGEADDEAFERGLIEGYPLGPGRGAAAVECARGRLFHALELDDHGQVRRFEFLAPTEWNFHPRGPLVRRLLGAPLSGAAQQQLAIQAVVNAFDACVGVRIEVRELADA